jgi:hypothetical protein
LVSRRPPGPPSRRSTWRRSAGWPGSRSRQRSRNLATLARCLALEFHEVVGFYGYRIAAGAAPEPAALARVDQQYGVKRIPASLFYDNDRGAMELEETDYSVPLMLEYRTPSMLFWRTYHEAIREYIQKNILD